MSTVLLPLLKPHWSSETALVWALANTLPGMDNTTVVSAHTPAAFFAYSDKLCILLIRDTFPSSKAFLMMLVMVSKHFGLPLLLNYEWIPSVFGDLPSAIISMAFLTWLVWETVELHQCKGNNRSLFI